MTAPDDMVVPLASEDVSVVKQERVIGGARIHVMTDTVEELLSADLATENVEITRVDVNRYLEPGEEPPAQRSENGVVIIPVIEEVAVVQKRLLLREEIHIHSRTTTETVEMPVALRRQRAEVERLNPDDLQPTKAKETDT